MTLFIVNWIADHPNGKFSWFSSVSQEKKSIFSSGSSPSLHSRSSLHQISYRVASAAENESQNRTTLRISHEQNRKMRVTDNVCAISYYFMNSVHHTRKRKVTLEGLALRTYHLTNSYHWAAFNTGGKQTPTNFATRAWFRGEFRFVPWNNVPCVGKMNWYSLYPF